MGGWEKTQGVKALVKMQECNVQTLDQNGHAHDGVKKEHHVRMSTSHMGEGTKQALARSLHLCFATRLLVVLWLDHKCDPEAQYINSPPH